GAIDLQSGTDGVIAVGGAGVVNAATSASLSGTVVNVAGTIVAPNATLIAKTNSWYLGSNVEGKPRRVLSYCGGVGTYRQKCDEVAASGYRGFAMQ
ncbi:MAG: hypothetical protein ACK463_14140, partial [Bradyrhizobium sp.]